MNLKIKKEKTEQLTFIVNIEERSGLKIESNKSIIQEQSKGKLKATYNSMLGYICKPELKKEIDSIQIIGHTDKNIVNADPKYGNLKLSQARALSVLQFGLDLFDKDAPKRDCLLELASINGRGSAELKKTDEESRRVEFKIRVKSYEQKKKSVKFIRGNNGNQENRG